MQAVRFQAERGKGAVTPTSILARKLVEGYLTLRGRFRHLFEPMAGRSHSTHSHAGRCIMEPVNG
jgi:hypothetical protein